MQPDDLIGSNNTGGNIFLQAAPDGDYEITTHLSADCNANYLQAFLVVWQDPNNYVMCKTAYDNGAVFVASKEANETVTETATPNTIGADVYLKIEKTGQNYGCCYSADGTNWIQIGPDIAFDIKEEKVGFGGWKASPDLVGIWRANFDWFHINGVSAAMNAYEAWTAAYNLEGSNAWSWIDLEPDGMNNLLEYALGGNPTNADAATVLPSGEMVPILGTNWLELVYLRRHDYAARGLTYTVKAATSLTPGQWSTNGVAPGGSEPFDEEFDTVTDRISTENEPAGFLRLEVRQN
jgi:regulation of enolase protein 1 (concanavalin A-like superfamily)